MAQGTIFGTTANKAIESKIEWSSNPSTANNSSTVTASLLYRRNNTYSGTPTNGTGTVSVTIDGQSNSETVTLTIPNDNSWVEAIKVEKTVSHNSDGTRSITISASGSLPPSSLSATYCSGIATLDNITRKATITSAPDFTDEDTPTVYYSNPAGDSVEELDICIADNRAWDVYVPYQPVEKNGDSYTFTKEDIDKLKTFTVNTLEVSFVIRTKIGGQYYYSPSYKTFTVTENEDTKPSVSMTATLNNGSLPSEFDGLYIQGKSRLDVSLSAEGKYSATITGYSVDIGGDTYNSQSFLSNVIKKSGKVSIVGYAKDSRGFTGFDEQEIEVAEYSKPLVVPLNNENAITCYRSDGNGNRIGNSTSVWIKAKRLYYSLSGINQCALQWRRKLVSEVWNDNVHQWKDLISKTNTSSSEYSNLLADEVFDLTKSYTVQIMATDDIGEKDVKEFEIPTQDVALHLGRGGKNVSIGTYCDYSKDYTFYSNWDAYFDKNVYIQGKSIEEFIIETVNKGG